MKKNKRKNPCKKGRPSLLGKIIKTLPVLLAVMVVIYAGLLLQTIELPTVLPVTEVQVKGEMKYLNKDEIEKLTKENITGGFFTVDLRNIREVLKNRPWVRDVSLRRKWPASLAVFIEEQIPVAYWNDDAYLSKNGDIFRPEDIDKKLNLPNLNGPEGQHDNVWKFMNVLYKETAMLNYEVVRLNLDGRRAWQLELAETAGMDGAALAAESIEIKLGRFDTEKRLQRFVQILPALTIGYGIQNNDDTKSRIKVIDMRYPNGFAVQLSEA